MKDTLVIFDTTLRDGEQSPGASMTREEKVRIAKALEKLRVDVIEAGFPAASQGDFDSVQAVAKAVKDAIICGLSRAVDRDIDLAGEAIKPASRGRIHTFIATSPIHMEKKLRMTPEEVVERAVYAVKRARQYTDDVEFSAEDAGRSDPEFLCRVFEAVINAGATTINIPDTVGYNLPEQFGALFKFVISNTPNSDKAIFSAHCHNDLGLAVANSLAAAQNGARQIECTINGLGERAGNTALEEVVMAIRTRQNFFAFDTNINTKEIMTTSRMVSAITGFAVQPNKAIVGANAFAHESGIHQDGVLKHRETYEIMRAEDVGWSANKMVLGKHSGRNALRARLTELGVSCDTEEELNRVFVRFKELADVKHEIYDEDLLALVADETVEMENDQYRLVSLKVVSETGEMPSAQVTIWMNGEEHHANAQGAGAVDATFKAIESLVDSGANLLLYSVNNVTNGTDSQGETAVRLEKGGRVVNGQGTDTDIMVSSARAYINALNKLAVKAKRSHPQYQGAV
jgi:2-isopropylmalate synthase